MRILYRKVKKYNIVNIEYIINIFKPNYLDNIFSDSDKTLMKNDWGKVGEDLRWGIKQIKVN
ncbi:hypothetical protein [Clostridium sp.]|uniref:hypothetical protein n=1 Tax=Clostridium sp. TaxID=1506 RepID=UPI0025BB93B5|nr:hypothetical protein [Clostridium sp.]